MYSRVTILALEVVSYLELTSFDSTLVAIAAKPGVPNSMWVIR